MNIAPLRASRAMLAASASLTLVFGFASSAYAQSRHVRVAGRLIPEHASIAPQDAPTTPRHGSHPQRSHGSDSYNDRSDALPEADGLAGTKQVPEASIPSPELPETERVAEREEEAEAEGVAEDEALDGLLGPFLPREFGGVTGEYIYTGEVFMNARGGIATANSTRYRGNLDVVVQVDTQKQ